MPVHKNRCDSTTTTIIETVRGCSMQTAAPMHLRSLMPGERPLPAKGGQKVHRLARNQLNIAKLEFMSPVDELQLNEVHSAFQKQQATLVVIISTRFEKVEIHQNPTIEYLTNIVSFAPMKAVSMKSFWLEVMRINSCNHAATVAHSKDVHGCASEIESIVVHKIHKETKSIQTCQTLQLASQEFVVQEAKLLRTDAHHHRQDHHHHHHDHHHHHHDHPQHTTTKNNNNASRVPPQPVNRGVEPLERHPPRQLRRKKHNM